MNKYDNFANYLGTKFNHDFSSVGDFEYKDVTVNSLYIKCKHCNIIFQIWADHNPNDFKDGILYENKMYEVYQYLNGYLDLVPIKIYEILNCNEQIIKNMLE